MALNEPPSGLNISLQIFKDVNKCIICQKNKDNRLRELFEKKTEIAQIEDLNNGSGPSTSFTKNRPKQKRVLDVNFTLPAEKP